VKDTPSGTEKTFTPRTPLGKKLLSIRTQAIEKGVELLNANGVTRKVKQQRGETNGDNP